MTKRQIYRLAMAVGILGAAYGVSMELSFPGRLFLTGWSVPLPVRLIAVAALFGLGAIATIGVSGAMVFGIGWVYFLPSIIAHRRGHPQKTPILLINLLLGMVLGIGWVVALIWANSALPSGAPAAIATDSGFCPHCGTARMAGTFCPHCGTRLG